MFTAVSVISPQKNTRQAATTASVSLIGTHGISPCFFLYIILFSVTVYGNNEHISIIET